MKKKVLFLMVFYLFYCGCQAQKIIKIETPAQRNMGLKQENSDYIWDFGKVKEGAVVTHDFILTNNSNKLLLIKDYQASCGCTVPKVEKKEIPPGENTKIEVKFNSQKYSGQVQQYVYVTTDNIDNPVVRLIIKAFVVKEGV